MGSIYTLRQQVKGFPGVTYTGTMVFYGLKTAVSRAAATHSTGKQLDKVKKTS